MADNQYTEIDLTVGLTYDPDEVIGAEDFEVGQTPEEYLRNSLAGFIENEVNNTVEFPATATVKLHSNFGFAEGND